VLRRINGQPPYRFLNPDPSSRHDEVDVDQPAAVKPCCAVEMFAGDPPHGMRTVRESWRREKRDHPCQTEEWLAGSSVAMPSRLASWRRSIRALPNDAPPGMLTISDDRLLFMGDVNGSFPAATPDAGAAQESTTEEGWRGWARKRPWPLNSEAGVTRHCGGET